MGGGPRSLNRFFFSECLPSKRRWLDPGDCPVRLNRFFISECLPREGDSVVGKIVKMSQSLLHQRMSSERAVLVPVCEVDPGLNRFFISECLPSRARDGARRN